MVNVNIYGATPPYPTKVISGSGKYWHNDVVPLMGYG